MSIKGNLFKAIAERLTTELNFAPEEPLPNLKWVDKNKGQLQNWSDFGAIPLPAVLVSFPEIAWQNNGNNNQSGLCRVRVILLYEVYSEFYNDSPDQEDAIKCWDYEEQMYAALQGFGIDNVSPLNRIASSEEEDHDALVTFTQDYECIIQDTGANTFRKYVKVLPDLVVTYNKDQAAAIPRVAKTSGFNI